MFIIAIVFVAITVVIAAITVVIAASLKAAAIDHAANAAYREDYYANFTK